MSLLDVKTGLLTGPFVGKQGWKCPVALLAICCGSKSLKVILIDSHFRAYPVLNPLVTLSWTPSFRKDQTCRRIGVYMSSEDHLHRNLTWQGIQDMTDSGNLPWVCLLWKNVSVGDGLRRMSRGPQQFESNNWQRKGCLSVCRITINIASPEENTFFGSTSRNTRQDAMW